jgi:hypothetical protein
MEHGRLDQQPFVYFLLFSFSPFMYLDCFAVKTSCFKFNKIPVGVLIYPSCVFHKEKISNHVSELGTWKEKNATWFIWIHIETGWTPPSCTQDPRIPLYL